MNAPRSRVRQWTTDIAGVAGAACVVYGLSSIYEPVGVIALGGLLVLLGLAYRRP